MQLTRFRVVILLILAVSSSSLLVWHFASAISQPNSIVSPGSFINTATYTIWNNAGTYQAKDDTGNPAVATSTDIGALTNTILATCPTVTNVITARVVPVCAIVYRSSPGIYTGTTAISLQDDWYVTLKGETPCPLSVQNLNTVNASNIDIESSSGVIALNHNPNNNLGGGTIAIENLCFTSNTVVTITNGIGAVLGLGVGSTANPAKVLLTDVGVVDRTGQNTAVSLRSNGGDDIYEYDNLFATTLKDNAPLVYINVNHFNGRWLSLQSQASITTCTNATGCLMLLVVPGGNWFMAGVHFFGAANAFMWVQNSLCASKTIQFMDFFVELNTPAGQAGIQSSYHSNFGCDSVFTSFTWGSQYNPFNDTLIQWGSATQLLGVFGSKQFDNTGLITRPFGVYSPAAVNAMGTTINTATGPSASTAYTVQGSPVLISSTGGTGVSITIKDGKGNTVQSGLATLTAVQVAVGYTVNWGAFSVAPTVSVWSQAW